MSKLVALSLALAAGAAFAAAPAAGSSASTKADVSVRIVAPVKITAQPKGINFGNLLVADLSKPSSVELVTNTVPSGGTTAELKNFVNVSSFKTAEVSAAEIHYSHDTWAGTQGFVDGPKWDSSIDLVLDGVGQGKVKFTPAKDTPVDCALSADVDHGQGITTKHFGLGGKLDIEAGTVGAFKGTLNLTIEYK